MFEEFDRYLNQQDRSPLTIRGYLADLKAFGVWFQHTNSEALAPADVTPSDIKEYRQHLLTVERAKAATINRRLAALSAYLNWAVQFGQIEKNPAAGIRSVQQVNNGRDTWTANSSSHCSEPWKKSCRWPGCAFPSAG